MGFREALSQSCDCEESSEQCCAFQILKKETIEVLNRMAKDNSELRKQLEESKIQLENLALKKNVRENGKTQLGDLPKPFTLHPAKGKVPIRNEGRNGTEWSAYRERLKDVFSIYADVAGEVVSEMMNQGFTDHDIVDALFPCANGDRRMFTFNAGPCNHAP